MKNGISTLKTATRFCVLTVKKIESREEADKLFNGLSEGGKIEMPIADGPERYRIWYYADNSRHYVALTQEYETKKLARSPVRKETFIGKI